MVVHIIKTSCYLFYYMSDLFMRERIFVQLPHLHHFVQIHVKQLKYDIQTIIMSQYFTALHNVRVFQTNHCFNLSIPHCCFPRNKFSFESFNCIQFLGFIVNNLIHNSKGAFTDNFDDFKAFCKDTTNWQWKVSVIFIFRRLL